MVSSSTLSRPCGQGLDNLAERVNVIESKLMLYEKFIRSSGPFSRNALPHNGLLQMTDQTLYLVPLLV